MILWIIWLIGYVVGGSFLINESHRKMYAIKMKHNWIMEGNSHIINIDTSVSSMSKQLPISHWWHFTVAICSGITLLFPQIRTYFGIHPVLWIFPGTVLLMTGLLWGLHLWFTGRKNIVYSADSSINMVMNQIEKRIWSVLLLSANYLNLSSWIFITINLLNL